MKFNETQTSSSNKQSSYINYSGFNPFTFSGHLSREEDDGSGGSAQQSHGGPPSVCTSSAGRWSRCSRVGTGDPRALRGLRVESLSAIITSSSSLPATTLRAPALLLARCSHGVPAGVGQDSTQRGRGRTDGGADSALSLRGISHCGALGSCIPAQHHKKRAHRETPTPAPPSGRALLSISAGQRRSPPPHSRLAKSLKSLGILSHA